MTADQTVTPPTWANFQSQVWKKKYKTEKNFLYFLEKKFPHILGQLLIKL